MSDLAAPPVRSVTGQFLPGRSGNPAGRPRGARNKASVLAELIDASESEAIVRAVVDRALAGDWPALRACFTRLVAPIKEAPVELALPPIASVADVAEAGCALLAAVAGGEIAPGEAQKVMNLLSEQARLLEAGRPGHDRTAEPAAKAPAVATSKSRRRAAADPASDGRDACISPVPHGAAAESPDGARTGCRGGDRRPCPSDIHRTAAAVAEPDAALPLHAVADRAAEACISPVFGLRKAALRFQASEQALSAPLAAIIEDPSTLSGGSAPGSLSKAA